MPLEVLGTHLLGEYCLKQGPEVKFLTLGLNPEFLIKTAAFPLPGLCLELRLQGDLPSVLQIVSYVSPSSLPGHRM